MIIRDAEIAEIGQLAKIWHDGWQDAHARILPVELARLRTLESFRERLGAQRRCQHMYKRSRRDTANRGQPGDAALLDAARDSPDPPPVFDDFWTHAYRSLDA
jgi:hypothetical protein